MDGHDLFHLWCGPDLRLDRLCLLWVGVFDDSHSPKAHRPHTIEGPLTQSAPVTLTYDSGKGLTFTRIIAVDDKYMFTVTDKVANSGSEPVTLHPYALVSRHETPQVKGYYILHEGLIGALGGHLQETKYSSIAPM